MLIGRASATCISACSRRLCLQRSVATGRKEGVDARRLRRSAIPFPEQGLFNSRNLPPRLENSNPSGRLLARDRRRCSGSVRSPEFSDDRAEDGRERCGGGNDGLPCPRWACCLHKGVGHRGVSPAGLAPGALVGVRSIGCDR